MATDRTPLVPDPAPVRAEDATTYDATADGLYEAFRRAEDLLGWGHPAEAARVLAPVVEAAPESTAALELHARALFASAQLRRAEQALVELVRRRPDDGWARLALGRTLQRQSRAGEAVEHLRVAAALGTA